MADTRSTARRFTPRKLTAAAALLLAAAGVLGGQKAYEYAADPSGEKDCSDLGMTVLPALPGGAGSGPVGAGIGPRAAGSSTAPATTSLTADAAALPWSQRGGSLNDATCLDRTSVYRVVQVTTADQIKSALQFAAANHLKVSIAGARHSMGGHAFYTNALVLDMTHFNTMSLEQGSKVLTVQSGATWHDIQNYLHPRYAV